MSLLCVLEIFPIMNTRLFERKVKNFAKPEPKAFNAIKPILICIYLQNPQPHNKWKAISSVWQVQMPNVFLTISKCDKSDVETLNASLSHRTLSIVPIALRRLLHFYHLPFCPAHSKIIFTRSLFRQLQFCPFCFFQRENGLLIWRRNILGFH